MDHKTNPTFTVENEFADTLEQGAILTLRLIVAHDGGSKDTTELIFERVDERAPFIWTKVAVTEGTMFEREQVYAVQHAAEYVEEHYDVGVDTGLVTTASQ